MNHFLRAAATATASLLLFVTAPLATASDHYIRSSDDGILTHIFNLPACIPECTRAAQTVLTNDSAIERAVVAAIDNAERSVQFSQYTFSRRPILDALVAAVERGVQVRGVVDRGQIRAIKDFCSGELCGGFPAPFDTEAYQSASVTERLTIAAQSALYNQASNSEKLALLLEGSQDGSGMRFLGGSRLLHHKFVLVDDQILLAGSGNWSSTAVSVNLENLTISKDEKDAQPFACVFAAMWGDPAQRTQAAARCQTDSVYFSPVGSQSNRIVSDITSSIQQTQQSIDIAMHHLVHPALIFELTNAAHRGVRIRIITDDDLCMQRLSPELRGLLRAGAEIRYIPTTCSLFQLAHNKYAVFDQRKLINGSGNWSLAGLERNFENFKSTTDLFSVSTFHGAFEQFWARGVTRDVCSCDRSQASCRERFCIGTAN